MPLLSTIRQSDEQLTVAEKATQEAESRRHEAELKAEMETRAREESEAKHEIMQETHQREIHELTRQMEESYEKQTR